MTDVLAKLAAAGVFAPLDVALARTLGALAPGSPPAVLLGAAFASRAVAAGHVCADLRRVLARPLQDADGEPIDDVRLPTQFEWVMALGEATNAPGSLVGDGRTHTPLVFDGEARLYLRRYFAYQSLVADALRRRAAHTQVPSQPLAPLLARLFAERPDFRPDGRQREAAAVAALRDFMVLSGGPGTGKTTTLVRMLAALQTLALRGGGSPLRMALAAPTGKAAARMIETITAQLAQLDCDDDVRAAMPRTATTIHRLLGFRPGSRTRFLHDAALPLAADVVLVDEASMIDLALLAKLIDAVPPGAKLILVGDKHQLASVEAGAILGDICDAGGREGGDRSPAFAELLAREAGISASVAAAAPPIADCLVELVHSHRFDDGRGIGGFASAVKRGRVDAALEVLRAGTDELSLVAVDDPARLPGVLRQLVVAGYDDYLRAREPEARLAALTRFRLLCAHRRGAFGVERINPLIERLLAQSGRLAIDGPWYDGRPIMITANDYQLQLWNGDVGVVAADRSGHLRAYFPTEDGLRALPPSRLPAAETVFAMTVHKSQGSEFDEVALLLPGSGSALVTRELLYTGVTRARSRVVVLGTPQVVAEAIGRRVERASGLRDALWRDR